MQVYPCSTESVFSDVLCAVSAVHGKMFDFVQYLRRDRCSARIVQVCLLISEVRLIKFRDVVKSVLFNDKVSCQSSYEK